MLDAAIGSQVATNAVENNNLSRKQLDEKDKELALCAQRNHGKCSFTETTAINRKYLALSKENDEKVAELIREANRTPGKAQSIGEVEGFFTFNPVGKAAKSLGSAGYEMTVGSLAGPGKLAMDVVGISKELIFGSNVDAMGIETPYIPKSDFLRSVVTKGALATAGHYAGGMIDSAPGVSTIFAIYRKDPEQLGASAWSLIPIAAEAGVFTRGLGTGTRLVAGMAEDGAALPRSVTQLMGKDGSLLGEMADGKWVWSQTGAVTKVATTLDGRAAASSAIAKQQTSSPTSSSSAIRAQTANPTAIGAIADASNASRAAPVELTFNEFDRGVIPLVELDAKLVVNGISDSVKSSSESSVVIGGGAGGGKVARFNPQGLYDACAYANCGHINSVIDEIDYDEHADVADYSAKALLLDRGIVVPQGTKSLMSLAGGQRNQALVIGDGGLQKLFAEYDMTLKPLFTSGNKVVIETLPEGTYVIRTRGVENSAGVIEDHVQSLVVGHDALKRTFGQSDRYIYDARDSRLIIDFTSFNDATNVKYYRATGNGQ